MSTATETETKTEALRKLVKTQLALSNGAVYHRQAPDDAQFPYKVFNLSRVNLGDLHRDDYTLEVDIWAKSIDTKSVDRIGDSVESTFNAANMPQTHILPTFFRDSRFPVDDPDKDIQHLRLTFQIQLYTR